MKQKRIYLLVEIKLRLVLLTTFTVLTAQLRGVVHKLYNAKMAFLSPSPPHITLLVKTLLLK